MRNAIVLKGVYLHSPPWNMNNQLVVSAQKSPLPTGRVCHAYSEDNIKITEITAPKNSSMQ